MFLPRPVQWSIQNKQKKISTKLAVFAVFHFKGCFEYKYFFIKIKYFTSKPYLISNENTNISVHYFSNQTDFCQKMFTFKTHIYVKILSGAIKGETFSNSDKCANIRTILNIIHSTVNRICLYNFPFHYSYFID